VRKFRKESAKKSVSLNEVTRRAERDKFDDLLKQRAMQRKQLGIEHDAMLDTSDDGLLADERDVAKDAARDAAAKDAPDPLLHESAAILADAIGLLGADAKLAAQVLPESHAATHWVD
jgi:carboxyl-terminal processing protease